MYRTTIWAAMAAVALAVTVPVYPAPPDDVSFDLASFARVIKPMQHSTNGRLPLFIWNSPLPRNDDLIKMRESGELRRAIEMMADRGFVPTVDMGWQWTPAGAMAMAQTLQEARRPVCVLIPWASFLEETCYKDCKVWAEGPDACQAGKTRKWPCLPLADTSKGAAWIEEQLKPFKDAGIKISAVWFDDESLPHPWNGNYEAQRASKECQAHYPAGVLDDFGKFKQYCYELRSKLFSEAAADPIHRMFPGALTGNYGDFASSEAIPWYEGDNPYPPRSIGRMDALMPAAYANTVILPRYFKADQTVTQVDADQIYFHLLLRTVSSANANKQDRQLSIPYLSRFCPDNPDPRFRFGLSQGRYRELLRHLWLRGTDGMYAFNLGFPGSNVSAADSFESLEDMRAVYDELLTWREFLERGTPLNYETPPLQDAGPVWSALRLGDRCLLRTFALGQVGVTVSVSPFPGMTVDVETTRFGATYIISRDGQVRKVAGGLM